MDSNQIASKEHLVILVKTLEDAAAVLAQSGIVTSAASEFDAAIHAGHKEQAVEAAARLTKSAALVQTLLKTADNIDPHILNRKERKRLWALKPDELADEVLATGEYRERRLVLEAMGERTNRRLGRIAILAAAIALAVPFVQQYAETL
jgi:hypothetical protein